VHTAPYPRVVKGTTLGRLSFSQVNPSQAPLAGVDDSSVLTTPCRTPDSPKSRIYNTSLGLKKTLPYWYSYECKNAKSRWIGREIHEVLSTEFRAVPPEYHVRGLRLL
jgi:hypothetical protein